jgi:hypothetical protein
MRDLGDLGGRTVSDVELAMLERAFIDFPAPLAKIMTSVPLVGVELSLDEEADASGMGAEIQWMTPAEMVDEATNAYPGIEAVRMGLIPVGTCLEGTGDPYFYRTSDGAIVRVPHEAAAGGGLDEGRIELVARSVERLVEAADIEGPE